LFQVLHLRWWEFSLDRWQGIFQMFQLHGFLTEKLIWVLIMIFVVLVACYLLWYLLIHLFDLRMNIMLQYYSIINVISILVLYSYCIGLFYWTIVLDYCIGLLTLLCGDGAWVVVRWGKISRMNDEYLFQSCGIQSFSSSIHTTVQYFYFVLSMMTQPSMNKRKTTILEYDNTPSTVFNRQIDIEKKKTHTVLRVLPKNDDVHNRSMKLH
jgi:hypothetical protein